MVKIRIRYLRGLPVESAESTFLGNFRWEQRRDSEAPFRTFGKVLSADGRVVSVFDMDDVLLLEVGAARFGGYADEVIKGHPELFDGTEVHGVREYPDSADPAKTIVAVDNENPQFFSVYVHYAPSAGEMRGVECVGDFATREEALAYARQLDEAYGWAR